jgi:hypothetical protein
MSAANFAAGTERLIEHVNEYLDSHAEKYEIQIQSQDLSISKKFKILLKTLYETQGKVVIIIDEYDNPLLSVLEYPQIHWEIKNELAGFYKVLKECDSYIQFVFITGITKFAQVSLFSGMNQPEDISFNLHYAALCGFTQNELETYFEPEINEYAKTFGGRENYLAKLKYFYNGSEFQYYIVRINTIVLSCVK